MRPNPNYWSRQRAMAAVYGKPKSALDRVKHLPKDEHGRYLILEGKRWYPEQWDGERMNQYGNPENDPKSWINESNDGQP